jgi:hypothetical protein
MFDVSGYEGKKIKVTMNDGTVFNGTGITFMLAESCDEEFNSLVTEVNKVIKNNRDIFKNTTIAIYEDEVENIEVI